MKAADFDAIITACYEASIDASAWPKALDLIGRSYNASGAGIVFYAPDRNANTVHSESLNDADQPYREYWWQYDTRIIRAKNMHFRDGDVASDHHLIAQDDKRHDPFFQEFGRAHGFDELMGYFATDPLGGVMTVSVPGCAERGPFQADELESLRIIGAHASRAFTLTTTLKRLESRLFNLQKSLDQTSIGVIAFDAGQRVIDASDLAAGLMRDCLRIGPNRTLRALHPGDQPKIDRLLRPHAAGIRGGPDCAVLRSREGDLRLFVQAVRIRPDDGNLALGAESFAYRFLLIRDFASDARPSIAPHLEELGLTSTEARIAMRVGRGQSPKDLAQDLAISHHTVRAHLKSIFGKLDINKQSELSSLVARLDVLLGSVA